MPKMERVKKFEGTLHHISERAILIQFEDLYAKTWVPQSQINNIPDLLDSSTVSGLREGKVSIELTPFIAEKLELE